jgi:hypothetical protein
VYLIAPTSLRSAGSKNFMAFSFASLAKYLIF